MARLGFPCFYGDIRRARGTKQHRHAHGETILLADAGLLHSGANRPTEECRSPLPSPEQDVRRYPPAQTITAVPVRASALPPDPEPRSATGLRRRPSGFPAPSLAFLGYAPFGELPTPGWGPVPRTDADKKLP